MPSMWNWATDRAIIKYTCVFKAGNYGAPLVRPPPCFSSGNDNVLPE